MKVHLTNAKSFPSSKTGINWTKFNFLSDSGEAGEVMFKTAELGESVLNKVCSRETLQKVFDLMDTVDVVYNQRGRAIEIVAVE